LNQQLKNIFIQDLSPFETCKSVPKNFVDSFKEYNIYSPTDLGKCMWQNYKYIFHFLTIKTDNNLTITGFSKMHYVWL